MKKAQSIVTTGLLLAVIALVSLSLGSLFRNQASNLVKNTKITKSDKLIETTGAMGAPPMGN